MSEAFQLQRAFAGGKVKDSLGRKKDVEETSQTLYSSGTQQHVCLFLSFNRQDGSFSDVCLSFTQIKYSQVPLFVWLISSWSNTTVYLKHHSSHYWCSAQKWLVNQYQSSKPQYLLITSSQMWVTAAFLHLIIAEHKISFHNEILLREVDPCIVLVWFYSINSNSIFNIQSTDSSRSLQPAVTRRSVSVQITSAGAWSMRELRGRQKQSNLEKRRVIRLKKVLVNAPTDIYHLQASPDNRNCALLYFRVLHFSFCPAPSVSGSFLNC